MFYSIYDMFCVLKKKKKEALFGELSAFLKALFGETFSLFSVLATIRKKKKKEDDLY